MHVFRTLCSATNRNLYRVLSLCVLLVLALGNVWSVDTYYLQGISGSNGTGTLTGDFLTTASCSQDVNVSYDGISYTKAVKFPSARDWPATNYYRQNYMIRYDCKTTSTELTIVAYSTSSSANVVLGDIKESGWGSANIVSSKTSVTLSKNDLTAYTYTINSSTPASLFLSVSSASAVYIVQIIATEKGTALPVPGEIGYQVNFNKTRLVAYEDGEETHLDDNSFVFKTYEAQVAGNTEYFRIKTLGTHYIKFRTGSSACRLTVDVSNSATYYVGTSSTATTNASSGTQTFDLDANTDYYINPNGSSVYITGLSFDGFSCSAPTSVNITSATNKYFCGQDITLTADPVGGTGTPHYQWQKKINGTWTNVTNSGNISGATSANLLITNCGFGNAGGYRCIVTRGSSCETKSHADNTDGWGVHVFSIYGGYYGGEYTHHDIVWTSGTTGVATVHLNASSTFIFKVWSNHGYYYGSGPNNYIIQPNNWDCGTGNSDIRLLTGPEGDYTFTVNIEHGLDGAPYVNLRVGYPDVTHPSTGYIYINKWWTCYLHYWDASDNPLSPWGYDPALNSDRYTNICGTDYWYFPVIETYTNFIAKDNAGDPSNTTGNQVTTDHGGKYITHDGNNWVWRDFNTYTITFNAGGGTGTMSSIVGICPNSSQTLPANTFTRAGYTFAGWHANVATKVGGSTIAIGGDIDDEATLQEINGNITLTAQWEEIPMATIPGSVSKGYLYAVSGETWWAEDNDYFDYGTTYGPSGRWIKWQVELVSAGVYTVTEDFYSVYEGFWLGHQWYIELLDGNDVVSTYSTTAVWEEHGPRTDALKWDLSGVTPGVYTIRVTNNIDGAKPKLKSLTFSLAGKSFTYTMTPDRTLYGDEGDAHRAYGTITDAVVTESGLENGASVSVSGNVLTIGSSTITAPETQPGRLDSIPCDEAPGYRAASCTWRFDHWENVPNTISGDVTGVVAVYFPTFPVEYETFGGTINDDFYYTWYRYTGREEDFTPLPEDVTKEGYMFGGWYQDATTELFTVLPGHYYGGYTGKWCLKAHWLLPCDEPQAITKVILTGSSSHDTEGYNSKEYVGEPVIQVSGTTASYDFGEGSKTGYELGTAGDHVFVTVVDGFRTGDTIRVAITATNTVGRISNTPNYLDLFYLTSGGEAVKFTHIKDVSTPGIYSYTLSGDNIDDIEAANSSSVGVYRTDDAYGQNPCVYSVEIFGCRDLVFDDHAGTHVWSDEGNWAPNYKEIPSYHQATRILKPCIVDLDNAQAMNVKLCKGIGNDGSLVINADAALSVRDQISEVRGKNFTTLYPVVAEDLVIKSNSTNQGALVHGDTEGNTHATIEQYARGSGYLGGGNPTWQYVGVPFSDVNNAMEHYYGSEMCRWIENTTGNAGTNWSYVAKTGEQVVPFQGYALTNPSAKTFTNQGTLVPSVNQTLTLTYAGTTGYIGWNMFANSWMAPIDIEKFEDADFGANVQKTVYLMNTGINDGQQASFPSYESSTGSAGQYVAVPIHTAGVMGANKYIAPMQGFYLVTEAASSVTLRYDLVREADHRLSTRPNRAPRYAEQSEAELMPRVVIDVTGSRFADRLYILENANQTNAYDNGWDGYKIEGEDYAPQLMTRTGDMDLAVDVSPAFDGKQIAFRAGEDAEYTLHFSTTETGLVLRDLVTDVVTPIEDGGSYHFFASNRESAIRFVIGDNRQVPTGFEEQSALSADQIISLTVYTADGRLVLRRTSDFDDPLLLPQSGVYIFYMQTTAGVKIQKITF